MYRFSVTITKWFKEFTAKVSYIKNLEDAESFKKVGNTQYIHKQLKLALYYYNKSLRYAPQNHSIYALTLANRSAVHYEMGNYKVTNHETFLTKFFNVPVLVLH